MSPRLVVLGSLNMDLVVSVDHLPAPGETVLGRDFQTLPGGKGANQAYAAGKLGGGRIEVRMVGRVGRDAFGEALRTSLQSTGVDTATVQETTAEATGTALIWVDAAGQNSIVVASGANFAFGPDEIRPDLFNGARLALFQLETPLPTVQTALQAARRGQVRTILDPAPAQQLSKDLLDQVDLLTPNESEACQLLGRPVARLMLPHAAEVAANLLAAGPRAVVLKLGDVGSYYTDGAQEEFCPAFPVQAQDSTAAGDVFNAGLAVALAEDRPMREALRFASAAAAISVTRPGAQASVPDRAEVDALLRG